MLNSNVVEFQVLDIIEDLHTYRQIDAKNPRTITKYYSFSFSSDHMHCTFKTEPNFLVVLKLNISKIAIETRGWYMGIYQVLRTET